MSEADQELYKNFPIVISERWQQEITGKANVVFDVAERTRSRL